MGHDEALKLTEKDEHPAPEGNADGSLRVPWATLFTKGIRVGFGRTNDRRYTTHLRDMVVAGRARPGVVVTHHPRLEDAPAIYDAFDRRADGRREGRVQARLRVRRPVVRRQSPSQLDLAKQRLTSSMH